MSHPVSNHSAGTIKNLVCGAALVGLAAWPASARAEGAGTVHAVPHVVWSIPFVLLLLAIAILPLIRHTKHHWEKNHYKLLVGLTLGAVVLLHYGFRDHGFHGAKPGLETVFAVAEHAILKDFTPFIVLLFALYVISGGVQVRGNLLARPSTNVGLLGIGAILASFIGTTGASMVLIRPLLQTNRERVRVQHTVIFFIFLVSNVGGLLLPLGDPPLFLGYLQGVPFLWTLRLFVPWCFCVATLLVVYYIWDRVVYRTESAEVRIADIKHYSRPRLHGAINLVWLLGVVLSVALIVPGKALPGTNIIVAEYVREVALMGLTAVSLATTPRGLRTEVEFSYGAILEVACLFLGIFLTMQVPIEILQARGTELGLTTPAHFFWATGSLSSFLDNAPTYLVFLEAAKSLSASAPASVPLVALQGASVRQDLLMAISMGAVFMGANTYIGNGPNFMVKSIAEQHGVKMPSFFGYMLYSGCVLIPLFVLVTILFFA